MLLGLAGWNVYLTRQLSAISRTEQPALTTTKITPTSAKTISGAHGTLVQIQERGVSIVEFSDLPALPRGDVYELWVGRSASHMRPAGVFLPETDGSKVLVLDEKTLADDHLIAVTVEPGPDGTSAPTQAPGLLGRL